MPAHENDTAVDVIEAYAIKRGCTRRDIESCSEMALGMLVEQADGNKDLVLLSLTHALTQIALEFDDPDEMLDQSVRMMDLFVDADNHEDDDDSGDAED